MEKQWFLQNRDFWPKYEKPSKKHAKIFPKSIQNRPKIAKKSKKSVPKKPSWRKMRPKRSQNEQKLRKMVQHSPKSFPKGAHLKVWSVSAWPCLATSNRIYSASKSPKKMSYHAGGSPRTPAHCDASRSSAGVLFRDCAPAFFKFVNAPPDSPPKSSKIHSKLVQIRPRPF